MVPSTPTAQPAARLDIAGLESVYDTLAAAIDRAGPERSELFLVKLALLCAHALGDAAFFEQQVQIALSDL
ncbi:hypothetical protein EDC36_102110 [Tepidimonas ignava]|uniref:DUF2783 domain-containing protein n=1 Tax=Tepidimonas ignava TaxID=114249 RepID=A0A4R3LGZ4_9BURK|nr:DUF2783 domain-containing protein [Tepidimonas ignava]TCS99433.1 hypothetical protein EDC36_102110 [Tepidimonas ignava]TSE21933.1 hypothetical protein Tigna_01387 [Tepidimonas ignava]